MKIIFGNQVFYLSYGNTLTILYNNFNKNHLMYLCHVKILLSTSQNDLNNKGIS